MTLISSLEDNRDSGIYPFHMPGHKRILAGDEALQEIYGLDITEIPGFDDLHNASGIIKDAEDHAAALFSSDETHFLVNGSTGGILAAIVGSVCEGDTVIAATNCHRSVYNGIMLSGAVPVFITPETESYFNISGGIRAGDIEAALLKRKGKRCAVVITSPTYEGITSDVSTIAKICHENDSVLIVDAAHGAHFGFSGGFPQSAVTAGADVVITSVHKTLPAMTQTALIHINGNCPSKERIRKMLQVFMTSSPSYILMSSIDSMTGLLERQKDELFSAFEKRLDDLYGKAEGFNCLSVLCREKLTAEGSADHDRSKIVVSDMTGTYSGKQLADMFLEKYRICAEMSAASHVLFMTGIADTDEGFERLTKALCETDEDLYSRQIFPKARRIMGRVFDRIVGRRFAGAFQSIMPDELNKSDIHEQDLAIKTAVFDEDREYIPVELCEDRIAADYVSVYPPGIPVMIPGKKISKDAVDRILGAMNDGLTVTGLKDKEIAVLWERSSTL